MKTELIILLLVSVLLCNCKDKPDPPCEVHPDPFPFHDTLFDMTTPTKILFSNDGKVSIEYKTDTGIYKMAGDFSYELEEHAEWLHAIDPADWCVTYHDATGTINITQSSDTTCVGRKLNFDYELMFYEWHIIISGTCYNFSGYGDFDL